MMEDEDHRKESLLKKKLFFRDVGIFLREDRIQRHPYDRPLILATKI